MYLVQRSVAFAIGGPGRNWTSDTWIFSPLLLPAELLTHIKAQFVLQNVGLEPTTHCLSDNCSTKWANLATKLFAVRALWLREDGFEPSIFGLWGQRLNRLSTPQWYQRWDSNSRPLPYEGNALTNWATRAYRSCCLSKLSSVFSALSIAFNRYCNRNISNFVRGDSDGFRTHDLQRDRLAF